MDFKSFANETLLLKVKSTTSKIYETIVDTDNSTSKDNLSSLDIFKRTARYKLAGIGIPVSANEKTLLSLYNLHLGERAFIIGNGPSLNKCDLSLLKNETTFAVNNIYLNYEK